MILLLYMDLSAQVTQLETDTLSAIRISGIFIVFGVALFAFTDKGKTFSLISLFVSLLLFFSLVTNYLIRKYDFAHKGFNTTTLTDVIVYIMVGVILLNIWMIYQVWKTDETSLTQVAKDIQEQVSLANKVNAQIIQGNLAAIQENRQLISKASEALGFPVEPNQTSISDSRNAGFPFGGNFNKIQTGMKGAIQTHGTIDQALQTTSGLKQIEQARGTRTNAVLASIA